MKCIYTYIVDGNETNRSICNGWKSGIKRKKEIKKEFILVYVWNQLSECHYIHWLLGISIHMWTPFYSCIWNNHIYTCTQVHTIVCKIEHLLTCSNQFELKFFFVFCFLSLSRIIQVNFALQFFRATVGFGKNVFKRFRNKFVEFFKPWIFWSG